MAPGVHPCAPGETRREAAEEAGRVVRAFGPEARVVLLATVPVPPAPGPSTGGGG